MRIGELEENYPLCEHNDKNKTGRALWIEYSRERAFGFHPNSANDTHTETWSWL